MLLPKKQLGFTPVFIAIAVAVIAAASIGGYLFINNLNKPAKIKESSGIIHPLYQDLKRSIENVADHIEEVPSGIDADSSERYSQKGKGLIQTASDNLDKLKTQVDKLKFSETEDYKKKLTEYINKSDELIKYEKDNVKIGSDYVSTLKDYEDLTNDLSGVSNYIYSDPARYVKEVGQAIEKENNIIKNLEDLNEDGLFKKYHEVFIKKLKTERDLLEQAKEAVATRNDNALTEAVKKYAQTTQDDNREISRVSDEAKDKYKGVINDLKSLADKIGQGYNELKDKFKF